MAQMSEKRIILTIAVAGVLLTGAALGGVYWVQGKIEEEQAQITTLNGVVLYDVDTHALDVKPPFAEHATTGFIGIQRHAPATKTNDEVYARFRNIFVRRLR